MRNRNPALRPSPALFDVTSMRKNDIEGTIERVPLEQIELAANARRQIDPDGIDRLAAMLCRNGQLVPCIGFRPDTDRPVIVYDGQRRYLAARRSHELAGSDGFEGLKPVRNLIVLMLNHQPSPEEARRIQAQVNHAREGLAAVDEQDQFHDCWQARAGLDDEDRLAAVCADLGISARKAHNLRRQLTLPEEIRARVAERPVADQLSATMANKLADMHEIAPSLTEAVAKRISSRELLDKASQDLGGFVHRTVVEADTYAVRVDDGALLDGHDELERARPQLTAGAREQLRSILACEPDKLDRELDALAARAKDKMLKIAITGEIRDRARAGRFAYVHQRGQDYADTIWVIDPAFIIELAHEQLKQHADDTPAREEAYFAGARLDDDELRAAGQQDHERRKAERARQAEATNSNLGLGHDLRAGLIDPTASQLQALKQIVCHLLARHYRDVIAYGAGWSNQDRQQPVGDSSRHEPRHVDAILDAELQRALDERDPLRGIAQLTASWAAAFALDPDGITRTKTLGTERMGRKLADALPGGHSALRTAVWEFLRPMLSPRLAALHSDAFVNDQPAETTVQLNAHRGESDLADLDLGEDQDAAS